MLVLAGWSALWFVLLAPGGHNQPAGGGIAWRPFLAAGGRLLFSAHAMCPPTRQYVAGGLHLYANCPQLQIGPLAFLVAEPVRFLAPHNGLVAAEVLISVLGLAALVIIRQIVALIRPADSPDGWPFLLGGAVFIVGWQELAVAYAHLDDALVILCSCLAILAAVRGRPVLTGLALGLAIAAKPWALAFLPILLLAGGLAAWRGPEGCAGQEHARPVRACLRPALRAALVAALISAAAWMPFLLADLGTTAAFHYTIVNEPDSALRALGVTAPRTPSWDRASQVVAGCALGALAVWRGRWPALILVGVGARIALDPAAHGYYTAGLLAGALLWDLLGSPWRVPAWTIISYLALDIVPLTSPGDPRALGLIRLLLVAAFTVTVILGPVHSAGRVRREVLPTG